MFYLNLIINQLGENFLVKISTIKNRLKIKTILKKISVLMFWILIWEFIYILVGKDILIASPLNVLFRICELIKSCTFWNNVGFSMFRVLLGFILGVLVGTLLSFATCLSSIARDFLKPVLSIIRATPVASFIILALVWLKSSMMPVFISMLMVIPIIWSNITQGISNTDVKLLEMARIFKFSMISKVKKKYIPSVFPYFTAACTTALGLSWKAGIAAEVIGNTKKSIGGEIYRSKMYIETVDLFSFTIVVIILSVVLECIVARFMKYISNKYSF